MYSPEKFFWNDALSVGNAQIDKEHKKLFEIYNELVEFVELKQDRKKFAEILSKMTDYSLTHFKREEIYMERISYPKLAEHKDYHMNYIYRVAMYNVSLLDSEPPEPQEIIGFLERWWVNHIMNNDIEYERYWEKVQSEIAF